MKCTGLAASIVTERSQFLPHWRNKEGGGLQKT